MNKGRHSYVFYTLYPYILKDNICVCVCVCIFINTFLDMYLLYILKENIWIKKVKLGAQFGSSVLSPAT